MEPFRTISSIVTPLPKSNVDTDQLVPKQFLKLVQRTGFGRYLFYNWRYNSDGNLINDFVLNDSRYADSQILVTGDNFGCGSSREHAVWALADYGFKVVIAPSFADIFYNNCFKNGVLPISISQSVVDSLYSTNDTVTIDLQNLEITTSCTKYTFEIDSYKQQMLLEGLDHIGQTMIHEAKITAFERDARIPSLL